MPDWLTLAKGPLFRFTLAIFMLGLIRLALLSIGDMIGAIRQAGDRKLPYGQILKETGNWLLPFGRLHQTRGLYSYASFAFHIGILVVGLFLSNHLVILQANTGLAWGAIAKPWLDVLALVAILAGGYLLLHRVYAHNSRQLSSWPDYLLLVVILNIFVSGYLAGRPWNPVPYNGLMLFHTLNGIGLLLVIPFSKIAHCVLFPLIRIGSEIAWRFPPKAGQEVVKTLYGSEGRKI